MILDKLTTFVMKQPLAGSITPDVLDMGPSRDLGVGRPVYWYVLVGGGAAGGTSVAVDLIASDAADMSNPRVIASVPATTLADIQENPFIGFVGLPLEGQKYGRYLSVDVTAVGTFTDGFLDTGLTLDQASIRMYPDEA